MVTLKLLFALLALLALALFVALFIARLRKPDLERRFGWTIYALGVPAAILAALMIAAGEPWYFWLPLIVYTIWCVLGAIVDIWRPVEWRDPPRLPIFVPYVLLFIAGIVGFWVPLWFVNPVFWIAFAILLAVLTGFIIITHARQPAE